VDGLREVILASEKSNAPIKLLLKRGDEFLTITWTTTADCAIRTWRK
jgi:hypothetical protein